MFFILAATSTSWALARELCVWCTDPAWPFLLLLFDLCCNWVCCRCGVAALITVFLLLTWNPNWRSTTLIKSLHLDDQTPVFGWNHKECSNAANLSNLLSFKQAFAKHAIAKDLNEQVYSSIYELNTKQVSIYLLSQSLRCCLPSLTARFQGVVSVVSDLTILGTADTVNDM